MFSKYKGIADITLLSRNMLGKSMNSILLLMNGILMKCLMCLMQTELATLSPKGGNCYTNF